MKAAWRAGRRDKLEKLVGGHAVENPECTDGVFVCILFSLEWGAMKGL